MSEPTTPEAPKFELPTMTAPNGTVISAAAMECICKLVFVFGLRADKVLCESVLLALLEEVVAQQLLQGELLCADVENPTTFAKITDTGLRMALDYAPLVFAALHEAGLDVVEKSKAILAIPKMIRTLYALSQTQRG
jgi:hypothetical protein